MLVDTHCHITFEQFDLDRESVVGSASEKGVVVVNSTVSPDEVSKALSLLKDYENVYWTIGLTASNLDASNFEKTVALVRKHDGGVVGIGEVGLDYYWVKDRGKQKLLRENFRGFIELSNELGLPLVVHSRDAEGDCLDMLEGYDTPALLHCFSGTVEQARRALSFGCLVSIPTNVVYVKKRQILSKELPLGSIVLETDAPYLSPEPGRRNEPANVVKAAEKIAELRGQSFKAVATQTTLNAKKFFNL